MPLRSEIAFTLGTSAQAAGHWAVQCSEIALWEDLESWFYHRLDRESISNFLEIRGIERLKLALEKGNGAILCTGHVRGLFTFIVALDLLGYRVNVIRRAPKDVQGPIARWFNRRMTLISGGRCNYLWMRPNNLGVAVQAANALKRNEIVIVLIDARFPTEGVEVSFLNRPLAVPSGHVVIAQACCAPLLTFFVRSSEDGLPRVAEIGEALYPANDVIACVKDLIVRLEQQILRFPADWMWYQHRELWNQQG